MSPPINCRKRSAARRSRIFCGAFSTSMAAASSAASPFSEGPGEEGGVKRIALGSGFIVDPSGFIVTNNHVVGEAAKVEIILQDNTKYPAQYRRPRPAHRSRRAEDQGGQALALCHLRRQQRGANRRLGGRRRQSVRPRRQRHHRDHLGARARHPFRPVRRLPADRRADQSRQFRRADLQPERRGDRHQHGDLFAQWRQCRDRLCGSLERRQDGRRPSSRRMAR